MEAWPLSLKTTMKIVLHSAFPQCIVWGPDLITLHNDAFTPILGSKPSAIGRSFRDVWSEAWGVIGPIAEKAYAGQPTYIEDFPLVINRLGVPEQTYFTFCYSPIPDDEGRVGGMLDTVIETTAKVRAEKNARLLNEELAHRMQNTFTVVGAIVDQTFRSGGPEQQIRETLTKRIAALGQAHGILTQSLWTNTPIAAVVEGALAPHRHPSGQFQVQGPPLNLPENQALALALAIHELATNAIKYGSLSMDSGSVDIRWAVRAAEPSGFFQLTWQESGGPVVKQPTRRGFGSRLIEEGLRESFRGRVDVDYAPSGLRFELTTQLSNLGMAS